MGRTVIQKQQCTYIAVSLFVPRPKDFVNLLDCYLAIKPSIILVFIGNQWILARNDLMAKALRPLRLSNNLKRELLPSHRGADHHRDSIFCLHLLVPRIILSVRFVDVDSIW